MNEEHQYFFKVGIRHHSSKASLKFVKDVVDALMADGHHLDAMAYYDGYIRRKHGLIDDEGYEVFT